MTTKTHSTPLDITKTWLRVAVPGCLPWIERDDDGLSQTLRLRPQEDGIEIWVRDGPEDAAHLIPWGDLLLFQDALRWCFAMQSELDAQPTASDIAGSADRCRDLGCQGEWSKCWAKRVCHNFGVRPQEREGE